MLIHGRLIVTHNGLLLDEVRSLLQKSLRRQETAITRAATKELIGHGKDQLPWKSLVTFMFEDHCLSDLSVLKMFYKLYVKKDKYRAVELLAKCYTCRLAACLQVVALTEKYKPDDKLWLRNIPLDPALTALVASHTGGIDFDILLAHIVKYYQEKQTTALTTLFMLVNMAAKVENRKLTVKGINYLLSSKLKKPTIYQLVLTVIYKHSTDAYLKEYVRHCFEFSTVADVPAGLILFCIVPQIMHMDIVLKHPVNGISYEELRETNWSSVDQLSSMPTWAVDKHTYRGKFGRETKHLFLKKFKNIDMSDSDLEEFHGPREKSDIQVFFDVGCVCNNDILPANPFWEETKQMYLTRPKSLQKTAKMTDERYYELRKEKCVVFKAPKCKLVTGPTLQGKRKHDVETRSSSISTAAEKKIKLDKHETVKSGEANAAEIKIDTGTATGDMKTGINPTNGEAPSTSSAECTNTAGDSSGRGKGVVADVGPGADAATVWTSVPEIITRRPGPLLQLPTGSGKVYTILNMDTMKIMKGPYKSRARKNLCMFYHKAMIEVFKDVHTLAPEKDGQYIMFPLVKSSTATMKTTNRAFYDCIAKRDVSEAEGEFITREELGITQLHNMPIEAIQTLPVTIWAHFVYRYILNIGDSGLYNAITTPDHKHIYGIDMEENRKNVKGKDVMNCMFGKLPKKSTAAEVKRSILKHTDEFLLILNNDVDFDKLKMLYEYYQFGEEVDRCQKRLRNFIAELESML